MVEGIRNVAGPIRSALPYLRTAAACTASFAVRRLLSFCGRLARPTLSPAAGRHRVTHEARSNLLWTWVGSSGTIAWKREGGAYRSDAARLRPGATTIVREDRAPKKTAGLFSTQEKITIAVSVIATLLTLVLRSGGANSVLIFVVSAVAPAGLASLVGHGTDQLGHYL